MVKSRKADSEQRLTPEEFVLRAIATLKTKERKGVHAVRSGLNEAFRKYFGDTADPIETTTQMRKDGKLAVFLSRGGPSLYLREDLQAATLTRHDDDWKRRDQDGYQKKPKSAAKEDDVLTKILKG